MTRLLSCTEEEYGRYENLEMMPTHKTPDFSHDDPSDAYSAYNLPGSIKHWTQSSNFTRRKWVVKLDADMILRKPFTVREIPAKIGVVAAGYYGYLSGVKNDMAAMFVGPAVRERLAQVGGWGDIRQERCSKKRRRCGSNTPESQERSESGGHIKVPVTNSSRRKRRDRGYQKCTDTSLAL